MNKNIYICLIGLLFLLSSIAILYQRYEPFQNSTSKNYYKTTETDKKDMNNYTTLKDSLYKELSGNYISPEGGFDTSNNYIAGQQSQAAIYSECSALSSCSKCLETPDCNWCENIKQCVSSTDSYTKCTNDTVYNSILQCKLNNQITNDVPFESESILPIIGLSRDTKGTLTKTSLQIILDSLKARGYSTALVESKKEVLELVEAEINHYNDLYTKEMASYIVNGNNNELNAMSLTKTTNIQSHIQDLKDVSRFLNSQVIETFVGKFIEGFQQTYDEVETNYSSESIKNKNIGFYIQVFWIANLVALGTIIIM